MRPIVYECSSRGIIHILPKLVCFILFTPHIVSSACIFGSYITYTFLSVICVSLVLYPKYLEFPFVQPTIISAEPLPAGCKPIPTSWIMSFAALPIELVLSIIAALQDLRDIFALMRANRGLYRSLK